MLIHIMTFSININVIYTAAVEMSNARAKMKYIPRFQDPKEFFASLKPHPEEWF